VADPASVPDRRNRGWWSFRIAARDHVSAGAGAARAPDGMTKREVCPLADMECEVVF